MATIFLVVENVATQEMGYEWLKAQHVFMNVIITWEYECTSILHSKITVFVTSFKKESKRVCM
jgi:hypothetical protein